MKKFEAPDAYLFVALMQSKHPNLLESMYPLLRGVDGKLVLSEWSDVVPLETYKEYKRVFQKYLQDNNFEHP